MRSTDIRRQRLTFSSAEFRLSYKDENGLVNVMWLVNSSQSGWHFRLPDGSCHSNHDKPLPIFCHQTLVIINKWEKSLDTKLLQVHKYSITNLIGLMMDYRTNWRVNSLGTIQIKLTEFKVNIWVHLGSFRPKLNRNKSTNWIWDGLVASIASTYKSIYWKIVNFSNGFNGNQFLAHGFDLLKSSLKLDSKYPTFC